MENSSRRMVGVREKFHHNFLCAADIFLPQKNKTRHRAARLKRKHQYTFYMRIYCAK